MAPTPRPTATRSPAPPIISTATAGGGNGLAVGIAETVTAIAGTRLPTAAYLYAGGSGGVIRRGGGLIATPPPGVQNYAVNPQNGAVAFTDAAGFFYINSKPFVLSPMSIYGPPGKSRIIRLRWSADGNYLAFQMETPGANDGSMKFTDTINDGIWVYDVNANASRQVFRDEYRVSNEQRVATNFEWANDSHTLLIWVTPEHPGLVLMDASTDINKSPG